MRAIFFSCEYCRLIIIDDIRDWQVYLAVFTLQCVMHKSTLKYQTLFCQLRQAF